MKFKKNALIVLFSFVGFWVTSAHAQQPFTAQSVYTSCADTGISVTAKELLANDEQGFKILLKGVQSGDTGWIDASACVSQGIAMSGNASAHTFLEDAWAEALPKNPQAILGLEDGGISTKQACSIPFIEPEWEFVDNYYKASMAALDQVSEDYLQLDKAVCELRLKNSYAISTRKHKSDNSEKSGMAD